MPAVVDNPEPPNRSWLAPIGMVLAYLALVFGLGDLRLEHVLTATLTTGLGLIGGRARKFMVDMTPYVVLAVGYDLVRYARQAFVRPGDVLACGLRNAELALFSVGPGVTTQDFFAVHHAAAADILAAVPYFGFIYVAFGYAGYLFFVDRPRMRRYLWSLTTANYIAFFMWIVLPAAPPWYLRAHGCEIDLNALPDPAALARVDHLLGISYFHSFYSRSSSVFGALPSMHCAFPMLGLLTAWNATQWKTRWIHVLYVSWMAIAAVYLDHHWIIDAFAGWIVAIVSVALTSRVMDKLERRIARKTETELDVATSQP